MFFFIDEGLVSGTTNKFAHLCGQLLKQEVGMGRNEEMGLLSILAPGCRSERAQSWINAQTRIAILPYPKRYTVGNLIFV